MLLAPIGDTPDKYNEFVHSTRVVHLTETKALCNNEGDVPDKEYEAVQQMRSILTSASQQKAHPTSEDRLQQVACIHEYHIELAVCRSSPYC